MRKRLNILFKEFCSKVEKVASHYEFNLQMDVPFKKSGFEGNWYFLFIVLG
jgi:nucleosome binding factor SPN SPT16 subunit